MKITHKYFNTTHLLPLSPLYIGTNHQDFISGTQHSNREKADEIGLIAKASIVPIQMEEVRENYRMVILMDKVRCIASSKILIRSAEYDTVRYHNVLPIHQIKTVER